jgi:Na+-transporting methylmalonyl-CoA/oxaloacetate decarboxylase gamma subunit
VIWQVFIHDVHTTLTDDVWLFTLGMDMVFVLLALFSFLFRLWYVTTAVRSSGEEPVPVRKQVLKVITRFVVDAVGAIPWGRAAVLAGLVDLYADHEGSVDISLRLVHLMRLVRLLQLERLHLVQQSAMHRGLQPQLMANLFTALVALHWLACFWFMLIRFDVILYGDGSHVWTIGVAKVYAVDYFEDTPFGMLRRYSPVPVPMWEGCAQSSPGSCAAVYGSRTASLQ